MELLFKLVIGHALADFTLQTDSMAKGKNRHSTPFNVPVGMQPATVWPYWLTSHALIHGGVVWIITGSPNLAAIEFVLHWFIDFAKCERWTNIHIDQALHILCKIAYVVR